MSNLDLGFVEEESRPRGRRQTGRRRKRERRRRRRGAFAALLALVLVVGVVGGIAWGGYTVYQAVTEVPDYTGPGHGQVTVQIKAAQTGTAIGVELEEAGVVKSSKAFIEAWEANPEASGIQPGYYSMKKEMKASLAVERLLDPKARVEWQVTVREGLRVKQTLALLAKETDIGLKEFQAAAKEPEKLGLPKSAKGNVEGYLFPATYAFPPGSTATSILRTMVQRYHQEETELDLPAEAKQRGMTTHEVVTLASLLEAEARTKDFPKVSRVVYNRIDRDMPLQFDSTVQYALGRTDLHVTYDDLKVKSPYNTYKYKGLPPGPIESPGRAALDAALNPADGDWIYFVTTNPKTGETKFTDDPKEFQRFKKEYKRNRDDP